MPILVAQAPSTTTSGPAVVLPRLPLITLIADNDSIDLTSVNGIHVHDGLQGFDMPTFMFSSSTPAGSDGGLVDEGGIRVPERDVFIPLRLEFEIEQLVGLRVMKNRLARLLMPRDAAGNPRPVTIRCAQYDGGVRQISGVFSDGFNGPLADDEGIWEQQINLTFKCFDPFWQAALPRRQTYVTDSDPHPFFNDTFFPLQISGAQTIGTTTLVNEGDVDAYPIWTVTGPGENLVVTRSDGRSWGIDGAIASDEVLTIDTRYTKLKIIDGDGVNQWPRASVNADLWPLHTGPNSFTVAMESADDTSSVTLEWTPRYLTAWAESS